MLRVVLILLTVLASACVAARVVYDSIVFGAMNPATVPAILGVVGTIVVLVIAFGSAGRMILFAAVDPVTGQRRDPPGAPPAPAEAAVTGTLLGDDDFLNLSISANNAIIANIDALNLAAMALLALPVAFAVLTTDKVGDICPPWNFLTLGLLAVSVVLGFVGYEWGYRFSKRGWKVRDSTEPAQLLGAYVQFGNRAVSAAIRENNAVLARNGRIRQQKRAWILWAMVAFSLGAAAFVEGRSNCSPRKEAEIAKGAGMVYDRVMRDKTGLSEELVQLGKEIAQRRWMGVIDENERLPFGFFNPVRETGHIEYELDRGDQVVVDVTGLTTTTRP